MVRDGWLIREILSSEEYLFANGKCLCFRRGERVYTGRFKYHYTDGRETPWYTEDSAPEWLARFYKESKHVV